MFWLSDPVQGGGLCEAAGGETQGRREGRDQGQDCRGIHPGGRMDRLIV